MDITGDHRKIDLANINYVLPILYNEELYGLLIHTLNLHCSRSQQLPLLKYWVQQLLI